MRTSTIGVLALLALALPAAAEEQPKLAIGTIRGDASRVRRQILLRLCEPYQCVTASRVITANRPDPQKLKRAGVAGYLGGAVTGEPGQRVLILSLTTQASTATKPARTWRLRLTPDGRLRQQSLDRIATELDQALQGAAAQPAPSPTAPPQREAPPPPVAKPPPPAPAPPPKPPPAPAQAPTTKAPEPARAPAERPLRAAGEVGLWITNRKLTWEGASSGPDGSLRTYDASAIFVPSFRLEVYPGAFTGARPLLAAIGGFLEYGHSVGLKVKPPSGSPEGDHTGTLTYLDLGAVWRLQPFSGSRFVVAPALAYRSLSVTTSSKDGVTIDGLPDTKPSGFELRVDTSYPVTPSVTLQGGLGYTFWTSKKDIVGEFFGEGSAHGFEIEGGASWRFHGPLSAKGLIEYQSTSYTGLGDPRTSSPNDFGSASGAKDTYLGGRIMLRAEY